MKQPQLVWSENGANIPASWMWGGRRIEPPLGTRMEVVAWLAGGQTRGILAIRGGALLRGDNLALM